MTGFTGKHVFFTEKSSNSDPLKMAAKMAAKKQHAPQFFAQYSTTFNSMFGSSFRPFFTTSTQFQAKFEPRNGISILPSLYKKNERNQDFGFKSITSRTAFARKLYFGVLVQLAVIGGLQYLPYVICPSLPYGPNSDMPREYCKPCHYIALVISLITTVTLTISEFHRRHPHNYIALSFFTLSVGVLWMFSQNHFGTRCFLLHLAVSIGCLFVYTCQTLFPYTVWVGLITVLLLSGGSYLMMIHCLQDVEDWEVYYFKTYLWADLVATIVLLFFVVDIHLMTSGTHLNGIRRHEWVFATTSLYTDSVNVCIWILQILNAAKR